MSTSGTARDRLVVNDAVPANKMIWYVCELSEIAQTRRRVCTEVGSSVLKTVYYSISRGIYFCTESTVELSRGEKIGENTAAFGQRAHIRRETRQDRKNKKTRSILAAISTNVKSAWSAVVREVALQWHRYQGRTEAPGRPWTNVMTTQTGNMKTNKTYFEKKCARWKAWNNWQKSFGRRNNFLLL